MSDSLSYDTDTSFSRLSPSLPTSLSVEITKSFIYNYPELPAVYRLLKNSSLEPHLPTTTIWMNVYQAYCGSLLIARVDYVTGLLE